MNQFRAIFLDIFHFCETKVIKISMKSIQKKILDIHIDYIIIFSLKSNFC